MVERVKNIVEIGEDELERISGEEAPMEPKSLDFQNDSEKRAN